jgi:four helix bundle protein
MNEREFQRRTKTLALQAIRLTDLLPKTATADVLFRQLLRSATSVGANYRAACRARSSADMINKLRIVEEEADESIYWMELLAESGVIPPACLSELMKQADEIVAMTVASIKTLRGNSQSANPKSAIGNRRP